MIKYLLGLPIALMVFVSLFNTHIFEYTVLFNITLAIAITAGVVSGLSIFGSGIDSTGTRIIFIGAGLGGLWGELTLANLSMLFTVPYMSIIWSVISVIYILGLIMFMGGMNND